jgi:predicted ATPase
MRLAPGAQVDRYVVEGLLGSGGMAEVYAVRHASLGSRAALKVMTVRSAALAGRMLREGRAQASVQHPNLVAVLDLLEVDGAPALVMERVDGPTLAQLITDGALSLPRIERLVRGMMLGLHAAHARSIVHRDLKPSNVLVAPGDLPRIADFGLATAMAEEPDGPLTRPGIALGTPAYMAPEQHEDAHRVDTRADIFALGVVMYEMFAGHAPAAGCGVVAAWQKMTQKRWRPLSEVVSGLPGRIESAIAWALEPERDQRAPSVAALWERWFEEDFPADLSAGVSVVQATASSRESEPPSSIIPRAGGELLGREQDLHALQDLLEAGGGLVTVVGTAGVGKTRLSIEVANRWLEAHKPAIWVDLQAASDEQDLAQRVAWLLQDGDASPSALARALRRCGPLLLVLDNFEHLPRSAAHLLLQWLSAAPSLRALVTSRHALGLPGETTVEVLPLLLPASPEEVEGSIVWKLFAASAPPRVLDGIEPARLHSLLQELDGLPLALELAAARLEVLTVDELEQRLGDRFALLSDPGSSSARHSALYDAIDSSWSLLGEPERQGLAQLSAFVAPFTLEAAEAVLALPVPVLDALHNLVRRSLVHRKGGWFRLLRSVRDFAERKLTAEDKRALWGRHAAWFASVSLRWQRRQVMGTELAHRSLAEASPELGAVLERVVRDPAPEARAVEDALMCASGRAFLFNMMGPTEGALRVIELARSLPDLNDATHQGHLDMRLMQALAIRRTGRVEESRALLRELIAGGLPDDMMATACAQLADLAEGPRDGEAMELYQRALAVADPSQVSLVASCHAAVAMALASHDRYDEASVWLDKALALAPPDDLTAALEVQKARAWIATNRDDFPEGLAAYQQVRAMATRRHDARGMFYATGQLGILAEGMGDLPAAERYLAEAAAGMEDQGDTLFVGYWRAYHGRVLLALGRVEEGEAELVSVLHEVKGLDPSLRSTFALAAGFAAARTRPEEAERWGLEAAEKPQVNHLPGLIARGFAAAREGDRSSAGQLAAEARAALPALADVATRALARRLVEELEGNAAAWQIARDGTWVEPPGSARISLQGANARIVRCLAQRALDKPGEPIDLEGLFEAGWPGEHILPAAAGNRVRVALSTLRRQGLAEIIERWEGGWRLQPAVVVKLA